MEKENIINQIFLTELCNQNCIFCSYDRKRINIKDPSLNQLQEKINEVPLNSEEIILDGGEPTIRKDFFEIVEFAKKRNPKKLTVCTNGLMLSYSPFVKKLKESGVNFVLVSLHSHKKEISDQITRRDGGCERTIKGIKNLIKENVNVSVSFVINKLNYPKILDYIKFVEKEFGKINITFSFVMPGGNAKYNKWIVPKISDIIGNLKEALHYCKKNNIPFSFTGCSIPPCFLEGFEEHTGEFLLSKNEYIMERESGRKIRHIEDGKVKANSCKQCRFDSVCGGLWEGYVEMYGFEEIVRPADNNNKILNERFKSGDWSKDMNDVLNENGFTKSFKQYVIERKFISRLINKNSRILDIGCANGLLLMMLMQWSKWGIIPYGIDINATLIDRAKKLFTEWNNNFWVFDIKKNRPKLLGKIWPRVKFDLIYWNVWEDIDFANTESSYIDEILEFLEEDGELVLGYYDEVINKNDKINAILISGYKIERIIVNPLTNADNELLICLKNQHSKNQSKKEYKKRM